MKNMATLFSNARVENQLFLCQRLTATRRRDSLDLEDTTGSFAQISGYLLTTH